MTKAYVALLCSTFLFSCTVNDSSRCHMLPSGADGVYNLKDCPLDMTRLVEREKVCFYSAESEPAANQQFRCDTLDGDKQRLRNKYRSDTYLSEVFSAALCSISIANDNCE